MIATPAVPTVLAQSGVVAQSQFEIGVGLFGSAVGAFLGTLIVGGIMIAVFPAFTERTMEELLDAPWGSLVYGILTLVALVVVTIVLVLTVIGILVAIPLLLLAYVVWVIGAAIAYLAIGDGLVGHEGGWFLPLLVGSAINGLLVVTGVGGLLSFLIGAAGFGAVIR